MANILQRQIILGSPAPPTEDSVAELFHENTKLQVGVPGGGLLPGEYRPAEVKAMAAIGRAYSRAPRVRLPAISELPRSTRSFDDVIASRRSVRDFSQEDLSLGELARVLHQTNGITGQTRLSDGTIQYFRAAPSAGGLYPVELYLGVRHVAGVAPGLYHYNVREHALEELAAGDPTPQLHDACCYQEFASRAAVVFFFATILDRTMRKYGERGYRYVLLDTGHVVENLWLACTALGLGCVTSCGFFDDVAAKLLGLDGISETVMYTGFVGHPSTTPAQGAAR